MNELLEICDLLTVEEIEELISFCQEYTLHNQ